MESECAAGEFVGYDGEVYELRRVRHKKNRNETGNAVSSWENARYTHNWNNKGGNSDDRPVNVAAPFAPGRNGCIRCGTEGRNWIHLRPLHPKSLNRNCIRFLYNWILFPLTGFPLIIFSLRIIGFFLYATRILFNFWH